jgi:YD repeat-containing protein
MKNYVYHDVSLKLLSEIDANGFANFYEYNAAGELIRIKKETERGIMTIQESRSAQPKL